MMDYENTILYHYRAAIALNNASVSLLTRGAYYEAMLAGEDAINLLENVVVHPDALHSSSLDKVHVKLRQAQKLLSANFPSVQNQPAIPLEVETHDCGFAKLDPVTKHSICVAYAIRIEPASFVCHVEEDASVMVAIFLGNLGVARLCQARQEPCTSLAEALQRNALQVLAKSHDILVTKCNQEKNPLQRVQHLFTLSLSMQNLIQALSDLGRLSEAEQCHIALIDARHTIQRIKVKRSLPSGDTAAAA